MKKRNPFRREEEAEEEEEEEVEEVEEKEEKEEEEGEKDEEERGWEKVDRVWGIKIEGNQCESF